MIVKCPAKSYPLYHEIIKWQQGHACEYESEDYMIHLTLFMLNLALLFKSGWNYFLHRLRQRLTHIFGMDK